MSTHPEEHNSHSETEKEVQITFNESSKGFDASLFCKQETLNKINKLKLNLEKSKIFKMPSLLGHLKRKNEIFYHVSTKEMHVDIEDTKGSVYLPLITKEEINRNLSKINSDVRSRISMVHLGAIKILIKAEFQAGIDTPIKMAIIDNRINDRRDCILGASRGNLIYQKFMFVVYPKFAISLQNKDLDQTLSFIHEFERTDLMNPGNKVFSLTYVVGYALSNSHHSIDYKHKENIELEDVFSEIGQIEQRQFSEISPLDSSWAIDIAQNKGLMGQKPKQKVKGNMLHIGTSSQNQEMLSNISKKIDEFGKTLKNISDS